MKKIHNAACCILICLSGAAFAQKPSLPGGYPNKPIRVIVGDAPGGGTDISARLMTGVQAERWASPFIVENRGSGIGAIVGMDFVRTSPPDGYTLLATSGSAFINAALVAKVPYDLKTAFAPISKWVAQPYVLSVNNSLPVSSVKELIALAKARPGTLNYASGGQGSATHLGMELFKFMSGVEAQHIPYKGIGPGILDLIAGQVQMLLGSTISTTPHIKSGKLKALAVTSLKRSSLLPDLPPISDTLPGFDVTGWFGVAAPAATPQPIILAHNREIAQILAMPDIQQKLAGMGGDPAHLSPEQTREAINSEIARWEKLFKETGLKL